MMVCGFLHVWKKKDCKDRLFPVACKYLTYFFLQRLLTKGLTKMLYLTFIYVSLACWLDDGGQFCSDASAVGQLAAFTG